MTYKLPSGFQKPLCRACGKTIKRYTVTIWPQYETPKDDAWRSQVIRVFYHPSGAVKKYITWDKQTYMDEFFCTNRCGIALGRLAARHNAVTSVAYADAIRRQRKEKVK